MKRLVVAISALAGVVAWCLNSTAAMPVRLGADAKVKMTCAKK